MFVHTAFELRRSKPYFSSRRNKYEPVIPKPRKRVFQANKHVHSAEREKLPVTSVEDHGKATDSHKTTLLLTKKVFKKRKQKRKEEKEASSDIVSTVKQNGIGSAKSKIHESADRKSPTPAQHRSDQQILKEEGYKVFFRELPEGKENYSMSSRYQGTNPPSKGLDLLYVPANKLRLFPETFTSQEKDWYNFARKWAILKTDFRSPIILDESRRQNVPLEVLKPKLGDKTVKNWKQLVANPSKSRSTSKNRVVGIQAVHSEWSRFLSKNPRIIVVGDVHGCVDELRSLLKLADFRPGDQVIFLGDLVAKGPDSVAVIKIAREIGARSVRGNHDFEVIRWWSAQMNGLSSSISVNMEHLKIAQDLDREDHEWLFHCPWFIRIPEMKYLLVHAGFVPGVDLCQQNPRLMMNMRSVLPNGIITNRYVANSPWASYWKGPETVVYGHDAYRGLQQFEFAQVQIGS